MPVQEFSLEIHPVLPEKLLRLEELANNLWYSWDRHTRRLFRWLDSELWMRVGRNPKLFLRSVDQRRLQQAAQDQVFLDRYNQVLSAYDTYHSETAPRGFGRRLGGDDLIAYFCAEYGLHESLRVYSGGLGILAGDYCKTASDMRLPFVALGLLYHQGYFTQIVDGAGNQVAIYTDGHPDILPVSPVRDADGAQITVGVELENRTVHVAAWKVQVGHIALYLLDTNVAQNNQADREITYQLYGGDNLMRVKQETVLGIGGVRMLRKLGLAPTVWHINEGHAAFLVLERVRERVAAGMTFPEALEAVAGNTVFTTHTPVPAGHDRFPEGLLLNQLGGFIRQLGAAPGEVLALGRVPESGADFNMTALSIRGARFVNGVSRIHGKVSSHVCAACWPQIPPEENAVRYVTNGVHAPTFMMPEWQAVLDQFLGAEWRNRMSSMRFWERLETIPDHIFWSVKQAIKSQMLELLRATLLSQHTRNRVSEVHLARILKYLDPNDPNVLTVGFARRFATYKRATLLFNDLATLRRLLGDAERPVVFIFAGKAHPADHPGQELMKTIHEMSNQPEFIGRILLVEGYDIGLARRLVSGVDVWLNNPVYPMEASGTSGMKAAINGAINLSVLDGWWPEAYNGENGWAIKASPHSADPEVRDREDARALYEVLEEEIIPLYYNRSRFGYSTGWVKKTKNSMATILPRFNMERMMNEYLSAFYIPASRQGKRLAEEQYGNARFLAEWKRETRRAWPGVRLRLLETPGAPNRYGEDITVRMALHLNGLHPEDVTVELLLNRKIDSPDIVIASGCRADDLEQPCAESMDTLPMASYRFQPVQPLPETHEYLYTLTFQPDWCGCLRYRVRAFPYHKLLIEPHEVGLMTWL